MSKRDEIVDELAGNLEAIRRKTEHLDRERLKQLIRAIRDPDVSVVPVVGRELLTIPREALLFDVVDRTGAPWPGDILLNHLLCQHLARDLGVTPEEVTGETSIAEIAASAGLLVDDRMLDRNLVYMKINNLMQKPEFTNLPIPKPLLQLACIRDVLLFATLNWDTFLERAAGEIWYGTPGGAQVRPFSPQTAGDIILGDGDPRKSNHPVVFKLFGTVLDHDLNEAPPEPGFAATEGDMIEFLQNLSMDKRPPLFFERMSRSHQLMLGIHFPSWVTRMFLRTMRSKPLWSQRNRREYLADGVMSSDDTMVSFIKQYCQDASSDPKISAPAFVERLCAEWIALSPERARAPFVEPPDKRVEGEDERDCLFMSYAREDVAVVAKIVDALRAQGWKVWFDQKDIPEGDEYAKRIERVIGSCEGIMPVLSPTSMAGDKPRFVYREWRWGLERQGDFTTLGRNFIHPVRLTADTPIPHEFADYNAREAFDANGNINSVLLDDMKNLLRKIRKDSGGT